MATTRSRPPRGREQARHASGGAVAEHVGKIYGIAIGGAVVIVAVLAFTSAGHVIDAAVQQFMLYYAGVFTLIALCTSVVLGFVATDRMVLSPGHRVFVQSAHRAVSFGALAFLVVHIVTEILAQRVHVLDAVVPFLSPFRTFYIGLGTIASDLIILLVITSIYRKRFTTNGKAWRWRAIHYCSYASFIFGVWHGLLGGRPGKPYVDWSYGLIIAVVALGLGIRVLASSLRPKESLSSAPVSEAASSGSAPMRAAAMFAQLGIIRAASAGPMSILTSGGGAGMRTALPVAGGRTGPMPAIAALSAPVMSDTVMYDTVGPGYGGYPGAGYDTGRQPVYEPGYDGPPRYAGAPRNPGTGPMPRAATGPLPRAIAGPPSGAASGPMPRAASGPMPRAASGPMPRVPSGPYPAVGGAGPRPQTGPMPRPQTGPMPRPQTGPMPRPQTGPMPRPQTGPMPRQDAGPMTQPPSGPQPRVATGSFPRAAGPAPRPASGPLPRAATGAFPPAGGPPARDLPAGRPAGRPASSPPWDSGLPMGDPALRYRDPGPGMPGYRGGDSRGGNPYGSGDQYGADAYAADQYAADQYRADSYGADQYGADQYGAGPYGAGSHADGEPYRTAPYPSAQHQPARHQPAPPEYPPAPYPAAQQSPGQYPGDPYSADLYPTDPQYPGGQYPTAPYPADPYWDGRR